MTGLFSGSQLSADLSIDRVLRLDEALQIVQVGHVHSFAIGRPGLMPYRQLPFAAVYCAWQAALFSRARLHRAC